MPTARSTSRPWLETALASYLLREDHTQPYDASTNRTLWERYCGWQAARDYHDRLMGWRRTAQPLGHPAQGANVPAPYYALFNSLVLSQGYQQAAIGA